LDLIFAFIEEVYGEEVARDLQGTLEYERGRGMCDDSFAEVHGGKCVLRKVNMYMKYAAKAYRYDAYTTGHPLEKSILLIPNLFCPSA
jgi:hypothetical protein